MLFCTDTLRLKTYNLVEAVKVWTWAVAANNKGELKAEEIEVSKDAPYLNAKLTNCHPSCE